MGIIYSFMKPAKRIIFYYQDHSLDLSQIIGSKVTHIYISAIHFNHIDGKYGLYINDHPHDHLIHDQMWQEVKSASESGIKIMLMIGGAGGAFFELFHHFDEYYPLLCEVVNKFNFIQGFDLDIEEDVKLEDVKMLIRKLKEDFPHHSITMAPVPENLQYDCINMGGFIYKELWNSPEGKYIDFFNVQFYNDFTKYSFEMCVNNGYPAEKMVAGFMSIQYYNPMIYDEIKGMIQKYPHMGGVFNWEYADTIPNPIKWVNKVYSLM